MGIRGRVWAVGAGLVLVVGGCGGSSKVATPTTVVRSTQSAVSTSTTSTTSTLPPTGPVVVTLRLQGDAGVDGPLAAGIVHCGLPTLAGPELLVIGTPPDRRFSVRITVVAGKVTVGVDTGSGAQYQERDFSGVGVTHFDAAHGATLQASLSEEGVAGTTATNLPAVASVSGTIDCGGQTPGSSTLAFSGTTPEGAISGGVSPVNVSCTAGAGALIIGIVKVAGKPVLIDMNARQGVFTFFTASKAGGAQHQYKSASGASAVTATGAHVDGDAQEQNPGSATPKTVHVVGDVTCGANPAS